MSQLLTERAFGDLTVSTGHMLDKVATALPYLAVAAAIFLLFWLLAKLLRWAVSLNSYSIQHSLIQQACYYAVLVIGALVALGVLGVDVGSIVTGLGLGGVALGFALKDILSNLVSGILMLLGHTFQIGDQIVVGETEGTVERIEVRATHMRTYDGRLVLVPNGEIFTSRVTNNTASVLRRSSIAIFLDYRQNVELALSTVLQAVQSVPDVSSEPAPSVRLRELSPYYMHVEARIWTNSRRTDFIKTTSDTRIAIVSALLNAGVRLPDPNPNQPEA
jgi:small-conductance mechanosensitive channel